MAANWIKVGGRVRVPRGPTREIMGTIVEVWDTKGKLIRVRLDERDSDGLPIILLLSPKWVSAA